MVCYKRNARFTLDRRAEAFFSFLSEAPFSYAIDGLRRASSFLVCKLTSYPFLVCVAAVLFYFLYLICFFFFSFSHSVTDSMKVNLEAAYAALCAEYHMKPVDTFLKGLFSTSAAPEGEVFIDASSVYGDNFCVFAELLRLVLKQPNAYIKPTRMDRRSWLSLMQQPGEEPGDQVYYAIPPRLLRLKLKLSRNVNNADVERLCELVNVQKELSCIPVAIPRGRSLLEHSEATETPAQLTWPEMAVIESIDMCDSVFVSLAGGRALRTAARRNVYLQYVFVSGCSVNRAVVEQIAAATSLNRQRFRDVCRLY